MVKIQALTAHELTLGTKAHEAGELAELPEHVKDLFSKVGDHWQVMWTDQGVPCIVPCELL